MKKLWKSVLLFAFLGALGLMLSCSGGGGDDGATGGGSGDGSGGAGVTYNYVGTQTAGDFWLLASDDVTGDFTITSGVSSYSYSGTSTPSNESGFTLMTVTDSDDPDFTGDETGYMVKVPGTMK